MTQDEWLQMGIEVGWCSETFCATHDGIEMTEEESEEWEAGFDPCQHAVRLWAQ